MARLIVEDITDIADVIHLINHLTWALASGDTTTLTDHGTITLRRDPAPSPQELEELVHPDTGEYCTNGYHGDECSCVADAALTDPRQGTLTDPPRHTGAVEFIPCPDRGSHDRLTDCWMCYRDAAWGTAPADDLLRSHGGPR